MHLCTHTKKRRRTLPLVSFVICISISQKIINKTIRTRFSKCEDVRKWKKYSCLTKVVVLNFLLRESKHDVFTLKKNKATLMCFGNYCSHF